MTKTKRTVALLLSLVLLVGITPMLGFTNLTDDDLIAEEEIVEEFAEVVEQAEAVAAPEEDTAETLGPSKLVLYITTGQSDTFDLSLGDAVSVSIASSDPSIATVSPGSLTANGTVTVNTLKQGTAYVNMVFKFADDTTLDWELRVMAINSTRYADLGFSKLTPQEAVDVAYQRRVATGFRNARAICTSDNETDDMNSMIRYILYANDIDMVGIIYSSSTHHWEGDGINARTGGNATIAQLTYRWQGAANFQVYIEEYRKVLDNLKIHDPNYPDADYLRDMVYKGNTTWYADMAEDTPGSDLIKYTLLDERDDSPIHISAWGGPCTIARALKAIEDEYIDTPEWPAMYERISRIVKLNLSGTQDTTYANYIARNWPNIESANTSSPGQAIGFGAGATNLSHSYFLKPEFMLARMYVSPYMAHYQTYNDGLNLTQISYQPNTVEPVAYGTAYNGHIEVPTGWSDRFITGNTSHSNVSRQGLNSAKPDQANATGTYIPAPWPKGARMHRQVCPITDPRWDEFGEPQHEDFGNPTVPTYWGGNKPPRYTFYSEGDSQCFLGLINNGLRGDESFRYGGWGGRYSRTGTTGLLTPQTDVIPTGTTGTAGTFSLQRFIPDMQRDFATRILWTVTPKYEDGNHAPVVTVEGLDRFAFAGDTLALNGVASDPDGDPLTYRWYRYADADSLTGTGTVELASTAATTFTVPATATAGQTAHLILEVDDRATPAPAQIDLYLKSYQRVIVTVANRANTLAVLKTAMDKFDALVAGDYPAELYAAAQVARTAAGVVYAAGETAAYSTVDGATQTLLDAMGMLGRDPYGGYVFSAEERAVLEKQSTKYKPNTIITTDGEHDDMCSMIRYLHTANEFNLVGLITTSSKWHHSGGRIRYPNIAAVNALTSGGNTNQRSYIEKQVENEDGTVDVWFRQNRWTGFTWLGYYIDRYAEVYDNLKVHDPEYPTPEYLRSIYKRGNVKLVGDMEEVTEGSEWIKKCMLENPDGEDLFIQVWGGPSIVARALRSIEAEYKGTADWNRIFNKISSEVMLFDIMNQDDSAALYIKPNWPKMRIIHNSSMFNVINSWSSNSNCPPEYYNVWYRKIWVDTIRQIGSPLGSEMLTSGGGWDLRNAAIQQPTHKFYTPPFVSDDDFPFSTWGESNGNNQGGAGNNPSTWTLDFDREGDTPSYFFAIDNGLRSYEDPTWGGWAGRYAMQSGETNIWQDLTTVQDVKPDWTPSTLNGRSWTMSRWTPAFQADYSARAPWTIKDKYEDANHHPKSAVMNGLDITAIPGETLYLEGVAYDPDGDELTYRWWRYADADKYGGGGTFEVSDTAEASYTVPADAKTGDTIHLIFEVNDSPSNVQYETLTIYKRVVITVRDPYGGYELSDAEKAVIATQSVKKKVNTVITTDGEVDDMASFIRLLHYINEFNVKGIILSASRWHYSGGTVMNPDGTINATRAQYRWCGLRWPLMYLEKYEEIYNNLLVHQPDMPTPDYLRSIFKIGNIKQQGEMIEDTEGSDWVKKCILENPDGEQLVVNIWGGANTLCRALKSIEDEFKGTAEWMTIYNKINTEVSAYFITDQDQSTPGSLTSYIRPNWPLMRVFYNNSLYNAVGYSFNANASYFQTGWTNTILKVGSPLGSEYLVNGGGWDLRPAAIQQPTHSYYTNPVPTFHNYFGDNYPYSTWGESENRGGNTTNVGRFMSEGDNPAFWFIQDVGLRGGIENPTWGGWGGRFKRDTARTNNEWTDASSYVSETMTVGVSGVTGDNAARVSLSRWLPDMQNDFSARVQWGLTDKYADANHNPLCGVINGLDIDALAGQTLNLKGVAYDPDGDELSYRWWRYTEADTYGGTGTNQGGTQTLGTDKDFTYTVPANAAPGQTIHLIFEVSDAPSNTAAYGYMKAYKRVVITVRDQFGGYVLSNEEKAEIAKQSEKKKINTIVTTDGEHDDMNSMVRYLTHANEFNTLGIILTSSQWHQTGGVIRYAPGSNEVITSRAAAYITSDVTEPDGTRVVTYRQNRCTGMAWIPYFIDRYADVYNNLIVHDPTYPTPEYLRSIYKLGNTKVINEMYEKSAGSELIKNAILDNPDGEDLYVQIWGGASCLARALRSIEEEYKGTPEWEYIYNKVSTEVMGYNIQNQDDTYNNYISVSWPKVRWINNASLFGGLYSVTSTTNHTTAIQELWFRKAFTDTLLQIGSPLTSQFLPRGGGWDLRNNATTGIQNPASKFYTVPFVSDDNYPFSTWGESGNTGMAGSDPSTWTYYFSMEGDTPSFFLLMDNGLRSFENPQWGGWAGRFGLTNAAVSTNIWSDNQNDVVPTGSTVGTRNWTFTRWAADWQGEWSARAQWTIKGRYGEANHHPMIAVMNGLDLEYKAGVTVDLKGAAYDPDGDELSYRWWRYADVDTAPGTGTIEVASTLNTTFTIPADAVPGQTIHLILEVSDAPSRTTYTTMKAYKRVVITVVADPSVSPDELVIAAGIAGTLEVSLGNGSLSAAHAVISSSNATVVTVDKTALAASGTVTVNAIRSGTSDITVTFWFANGSSSTVTIPVTVTSVGGSARAGVNGENDKLLGLPVEFSLWLDAIDITSINNLRMVFSVSDNAAFSGYTVSGSLTNFQPLPLQGAVGGILWEKLDDLWRGTLWLGLPSGGVNLNVLLDIVKFSFDVGLPGDVTLRLESMVIGSFEGEYLKMVTAGISNETGTFTTEVVRKYDLDRNGFVGQEDITIALRAVGWTKDDIGWNDFVIARIQRDNRPDLIITPAMCDVNSSGEVDMGDILDILRNLS